MRYRHSWPVAAVGCAMLLCGCASDQSEQRAASELGDCYVLTHDVPLIAVLPEEHMAVVPTLSHIQANEPFRGMIPAGTRLRVHHLRRYGASGDAISQLTFARIETGPHTGMDVATDRIGLSFAAPASDHVQPVRCP